MLYTKGLICLRHEYLMGVLFRIQLTSTKLITQEKYMSGFLKHSKQSSPVEYIMTVMTMTLHFKEPMTFLEVRGGDQYHGPNLISSMTLLKYVCLFFGFTLVCLDKVLISPFTSPILQRISDLKAQTASLIFFYS